MIIVEKLNESHLRIHADDGILRELDTFFSFEQPNAKWSPAFKARRWDGRTRLFSKRTKQLPYGLLRHLEIFAKERNYPIEGFKHETNDMSNQYAKSYLEKLQIHSDGNPIQAYEHQVLGVAKALRNKRRILESSTSSGKSLMIYGIVRYLEAIGLRGLIIVPTIGLLTQIKNDFIDYSSNNGWNAAGKIHSISSGVEKVTSKRVVISTWQSIYDFKDDDWFEQFDYVIGDEAHKCVAKSLTTIMKKLTRCQYRIGLTGTVQDGEVHKLILEGWFGPISTIMTNKEAIDKKISADLVVKALQLGYPDDVKKKTVKFDYQEEIAWLLTNRVRNNFIANLTLSLNRNALVLVTQIAHGTTLFDMIHVKDPARTVYYVHGSTEAEDRERIRKIMEDEPNAIVIASYGVMQEGISIKNLHSIIFASPSKSKIRVLQSIGRGLRLAAGKDKATLYDIADNLSIGNVVNYAMLHFVERIKLYNREEFKVQMYNIKLGVGE